MSEVSGDIPAIKADAAGDGDHPPTLAATGAPVGDARLAEPAQFRMVLVSFLAAAIGLIAGCVAFCSTSLLACSQILFSIIASLPNSPARDITSLEPG